MMILSLLLTPLSLASLIFWAGLRAVSLAAQAWLELVKAILDFHIKLCWRVPVWALAFFTLPLRIFTALYRESQLEEQLHEMKTQLENLVCENEELEQRLLLAIKERKVVETVFEEIEEEHEKTLAKIDLLENEIQDLKQENLRLCEGQGKGLCDWKATDIEGGRLQEGNFGIASWHGHQYTKEDRMILQDILLMHGDHLDGKRGDSFLSDAMISRDLLEVDEATEARKLVALQQSLFSAVLSFLVGLIIWEAGDPCMPLVAAVFTVVGMSLKSVVQFFFTIKNRPASDAVALLSLNCLMLGTLICPTLPRVARISAPWVMRASDWLICRLVFCS